MKAHEKRCKALYKLIRKQAGKEPSDRELARQLNMEWKSFANLKHGLRNVPSVDTLVKMAKVFGINPHRVFDVACGR